MEFSVTRERWVLIGLCLVLGLSVVTGPSQALIPSDDEPRRYVAYFGHDQHKVTAEADALLQQARDFERSSSGSVTVTAHADRIGRASYNYGLSRLRAIAVRQRLVRLGVPARVISLRWTGEARLPHPTADAVREPLNRCAVIQIAPGNL